MDETNWDRTPCICPTCHFYIDDSTDTEKHCDCGITWEKGVATLRDETDEELLNKEMGVMNRHIQWVTECNETLAKSL
jgi:hypothetical protein